MRFSNHSQRRETNVQSLLLLIASLLFALPLYSQNIDMDAVKSEEFFRWGVDAFHSSYFNKAIQSFEKALSFKPDDAVTRSWLGRAFYKSGLEKQALHEWNYLIENGKSDAVINNWVKFVSFQRSLGPELTEEKESRLVISFEIDGNSRAFYPFKRPTSVRASSDGSIYVVAFGSNEILQIDPNTRVSEVLNGGIEGYDNPYDIREVGNQYLFITEFSANRVLKCDRNGNKILSFGKKGTAPGDLLGPQYLSDDAKGYIYVSDYGNRRVNKYDYDGNFILSFGRRSGPFTGFLAPTGVAATSDRVFVADRQRKMIFVFDSSGNYLATIGEGLLEAPEAIDFADSNHLLVADTTRLLEIDIENDSSKLRGEIGDSSRRIVGIAVDANRDMVAVDFDLNRIFYLTPAPSLYTGYFVKIERVDAQKFPEVTVDISVTDRDGAPLVGLKTENFRISEFGQSVKDSEMLLSNNHPSRMSVAVLVERSPAAKQQGQALEEAAESIHDVFSNKAQLKIVAASRTPTVESDFGDTRLRMVRAVKEGTYSADWVFDQSVRLAASELFPARGKKAIVFLSQGKLGYNPYGTYSLMELAQFLRNNGITFNAMYLSSVQPDPDIRYLCQLTGGQDLPFYNPRGISALEAGLASHVTPVYVLRYLSPSYADFGRRYISIEAEVSLKSKSGYDKSGFYAPLEF